MGQILNLGWRAVLAAGVLAITGCGGDDDDDGSGEAAASEGVGAGVGTPDGRPSIVVTTNILGDMVTATVGDVADVEVIMPLGSDPHDFAPSARQAEAMEQADLLVVNGAGFEEGMSAIIENAQDSGTPMFTFADHVELIALTGDGDEEHADEEHADEEHADDGDDHAGEEDEHGDEADADEGHADGSDDPHIFTDPARMAAAVGALGAQLGQLDGVHIDALQATVDAYVAELAAVDAEIEAALALVADDDRQLVTNHEVFGYFADRYDFDVVGAVVPSLTTNAQASAADITTLADVVRDTGVPAIFAAHPESTQLADALADEVGGDIEVVELFSESLGEPGSGGETYVEMMRTNAARIAEALT